MLVLPLAVTALVIRVVAQNDLPPLQTLDIPITVDDNLRYGVQFNMSTGGQAQSFTFALSTGTGYSVVASSSCSSCEGVKGYNASASSSAIVSPDTRSVVVQNVQANGSLIHEDCSLRQANGSAWTYAGQPVVVANESQSMFTPGISGIFGLGTNGRDGKFSETVFGGWIDKHPGRTNFTYGMALNARTNSSSDGGVLHWLAPDPTFYKGEVSWRNITPFNRTAAINTDWFVLMDGWGFMGNRVYNAAHGGGGLKAFLDPWLPLLVFPHGDASQIYATIKGSQVINKTSLVNVYSIPCTAKMNLTLTFGAFSASMDESTLIQRNGDQCTGLLQEWASPTATEFLLGSAFIATVYLIFSVSSSENGALGLASRSAAKVIQKTNTVSIIGMSLGAAAFLIVVIAVVLFLIWRRKGSPKKPKMGEKGELIDPFPHPSDSPKETEGLLGPGNWYPQLSPDYHRGRYADPPSPPAGALLPRNDPQHPMHLYRPDPPSYFLRSTDDPMNHTSNSSPNVRPAISRAMRLQPPPTGKRRKEGVNGQRV